jgi:hypothetical protein
LAVLVVSANKLIDGRARRLVGVQKSDSLVCRLRLRAIGGEGQPIRALTALSAIGDFMLLVMSFVYAVIFIDLILFDDRLR